MHVLYIYIYNYIYTRIYIYVHACIQVNIPTISPKLGELARRQGCMAMTLCRVHLSKSVLSRVSDDHAYPGVPEDDKSVARWWFQMFNQSIIWGFDQTYIIIYAYFSLDSYMYNSICYIYMYYTTLHPAVVVRLPLQPLQPPQKTQLHPPVGPSVDSLCHPWFTATNLSYRCPIFETSATALCGTTGIHQ